jgi:hypothetical protein
MTESRAGHNRALPYNDDVNGWGNGGAENRAGLNTKARPYNGNPKVKNAGRLPALRVGKNQNRRARKVFRLEKRKTRIVWMTSCPRSVKSAGGSR